MAQDDSLDQKELDELEKKYDTSLNTRVTGPRVTMVLYWASIVFAAYHLWTAGFGTPVDYVHMGVHLAGLFLFIFAGFPFLKYPAALDYHPIKVFKPGNVPLYDWIFMVLAMAAALFLWLSWRGLSLPGIDVPEQMLRQGNPTGIDVFFGTILVLASLEIARRTIGFILPLIILVFIIFALFLSLIHI